MAEHEEELARMEEGMLAGQLAATLAISLLDKAFSYLDPGKEHPEKEKMQKDLQTIEVRLGVDARRLSRMQIEGVERSSMHIFPSLAWVLRGTVEEMEAAIDEIDYLLVEKQVRNPTLSMFFKTNIGNKVTRYVQTERLRMAVHSLREHTRKLLEKLHHLKDVKAYEARDLLYDHHMTHDPEQVFGRDREKEQIVQWLINCQSDGPEMVHSDHHIIVLALIGIAGMGKTTLAKLALRDPRVRPLFDFVVYVSVPVNFTAEEIVQFMLEQITGATPASSSTKSLKNALTDRLRYKKLLLVLDGIWEDTSMEKWEELVLPLRGCLRGSRILLTTRMQSVVDMAAAAVGAPAECLKLSELDETDNFMLFKSQLTYDIHSADYAHLLLIGEQISKSIGGCPLVTRSVSSWLGSHMEAHDWSAFLQNGWQKMGLTNIFASLRLSYDYLPTELQICFKYCSIFPKGYKFNKLELANMWIGSGLIPFNSSQQDDTGLQQKKGVHLFNAQDVGEQYFTELARKSFFFRMMENDPSNGNLKEYYVLHSLMHDLAIFISRYECARVDSDNFPHFRRVDNGNFPHFRYTIRHLSIANSKNWNVVGYLGNLRTLIIESEFSLDKRSEFMLGVLLMNCKYLRLLYLSVPSLSHALGRISNMIHLRYLFLFSCDESHVQRIFKLYHLQVFKLNYMTGKEVGFDGISNLRYLRYLRLPGSMLSKICQIGKLTALQELHGFEVVENGGNRLCALSKLTNLHQLSLRNLQNVRNSKEAMEVKLKDKQYMRFFSLSWNKDSNDPENIDQQIIDSLEPNKEIQQLHIYGYNRVRLPIWIENSLLIHLVSLELECCMKWKSLPSFQELSSLKHLKLENLLQLEYIGTMHEEQFGTKESEDAFLPPFLNTLIIRWCPNLKKLPDIPCNLEQLIIKHVGLSVLPTIDQRYPGRWEFWRTSSVKSRLALLHIESCIHLTSLDEGLLKQQQYLQSLKTLFLGHCAKLCYLPEKGFTELHHLNFLEIVSCPVLRNVKSEGNLLPMSLKNLDINPCGYIEDSVLMSLQNLTSLRRLTLFSCSNIEKLPSEEMFRTLENLNDVSIARCKNLLSLGGLGAAVSLRVLSILCCNKIHHSYYPQVSCSFKLYKLKVDRQALLMVEPIKSLNYTMELHIGDDYQMESLLEEWLLQNASSLCLIEIGVAENLQTLPSQMKRLESLKSLHIERAPLIQFLPELPASLSKLTIRGCDPRFLKIYETGVGSDWKKIKNIAHVDMKAYSEGTSDSDDQIQFVNDGSSNPSNQFAVID